MLAFVGACAAQWASLQALRTSEALYVELPAQREQWAPELYQALSLGQLPAAVDWLVLQFMTDPAYDHVAPGSRAPVFYDLNLATQLDPFFYDLYISGGTYPTVIRDDNEGARQILERGEAFRLKQLPLYPAEIRARFWRNEWQLPLTLGYLFIYELGDLKLGAEYFRQASLLPGAPNFLALFARRLEKVDGIYEVGLRILDFQKRGAKNEKERAIIQEKIQSLEVSRYVFLRNQEFQKTGRSAVGEPGEPSGLGSKDPWGGKLFLQPQPGGGFRLETTTPRKKVFGLD